MTSIRSIAFACALLASAALFAQEPPGKKSPSVSLVAAPLTTITRGKPGSVPLTFRISEGFHINSNKPKSEFLIPTILKMDAPTDIALEKTTYPAGQDISLPFEPTEKLNVYTGEFTLGVKVRPLHSVVAGKYKLHGNLKYQACDNAACYPPKQVPVEFEVKVIKGPPPVHHNPAQSPHIHN